MISEHDNLPPRFAGRPLPERLQALGESDDAASELIRTFVEREAEALHLNLPYQGPAQVQLGRDGVMQERWELPPALAQRLAAGALRMAQVEPLAMVEERAAQAPPRFGEVCLGGEHQARVQVYLFSTNQGWRLVCRSWFERLGAPRTLRELGLSEAQASALRASVSLPGSLTLVGGPTSSGVSETLESLAHLLHERGLSIAVVEDYREHGLGIADHRLVCRPEIGLSYLAATLRVLARSPDVLLLAELRDRPTIALVLRAASQGTPVLSSIPGMSALSIAEMIEDMGLAEMLCACPAVTLVSQRLLRRVVPQESTDSSQAPGRSNYDGRVGVFEVLSWDASARQLRDRSADRGELERCLRAQGMRTLRDSAQALVRASTTDQAEVDRVFGSALSAQRG